MTPDCAPVARRGCLRESELAGVLLPWHDRCHGSRVWKRVFPAGSRRFSAIRSMCVLKHSSAIFDDAFAFHRRAETKGLQVRETNGIYD